MLFHPTTTKGLPVSFTSSIMRRHIALNSPAAIRLTPERLLAAFGFFLFAHAVYHGSKQS